MIQKKLHNIGMWLCASLWLFTACSSEPLADIDPSADEVLYISLQTEGDGKARTSRADTPADDALNENTIRKVDFFVMDVNGKVVKHLSKTCDTKGETHHIQIRTVEWPDWQNVLDAKTYTIYALVNYNGTQDLSTLTTAVDVLKLTHEDPDILKWEGMKQDDQTQFTGKSFLMDGIAKFENKSQVNGEYRVDIPVQRAAAKVEITVSLSEEFSKHFSAANIGVRVNNYATKTNAWGKDKEGTLISMLDDIYRGLESAGDSYTSSLFYVHTPQNSYKEGQTTEIGKLRFYTYVNNWAGLDINNETEVTIDLPGSYFTNPGMKQNSQVYQNNFYKIPLVFDDSHELKRNHFYQIDVEIDVLGSVNEDTPHILEQKNFLIKEWNSETVPVGDDMAQFLTLNEYQIDIRDVATYDGLKFYSSSPVTVTVVNEWKNQDEASDAGINFNYPGKGTNIPGVYYLNRKNERIKPNIAVTISDYEDKTTGNITINSPVPDNLTKRYITLKVENQEGLVKYVVVEQYPLVYIQPRQGFFSYRDDFMYDGKLCRYTDEDGIVNELTITTEGGTPGWSTHRTNQAATGTAYPFFRSKVYTDEGNIREYWWLDNGESTYGKTSGGQQIAGDLQNPMMYDVTITSTSDQYNLSVPLKEFDAELGQEVGVSSEDNDKLVSPHFMLASHLGYTTFQNDETNVPFRTWEKAREHCAMYVEAYKQPNGKVKFFEDWRLPTTAEVGIIAGFQPGSGVTVNDNDIMERIFTQPLYRVLYSGARNNTGAADTKVTNGSEDYTYVRCVRDVKPGDFE